MSDLKPIEYINHPEHENGKWIAHTQSWKRTISTDADSNAVIAEMLARQVLQVANGWRRVMIIVNVVTNEENTERTIGFKVTDVRDRSHAPEPNKITFREFL